MKIKRAHCPGNSWWRTHFKWIRDEHKKGKFFHTIRTKFSDSKERAFVDLGFRICKEEIQ